MIGPLVYVEGNYSSSCGYCKHKIKKEKETNITKKENFGIEAYNVPAQVYDDLIQFNWRRCGSLYYRPSNEHMCCPQYAIRTIPSKFKLEKSEHRRVIRRLGRYLSTGSAQFREPGEQSSHSKEKENPNDFKLIETELSQNLQNAIDSILDDDIVPKLPDISLVKLQMRQDKNKGTFLTCNIVLNIFGIMRKHKIDIPNLTRKKLAEIILSKIAASSEYSTEACDNGYLNFYLTSTGDIKAQKKVESKTEDMKLFPIYRLKLVAEPSEFKTDEFDLYSEYQKQIHKDHPSKITKSGYSNFLCESSLNHDLNAPSFEMEVAVDDDPCGLQIRMPNDKIWFHHESYHIRYELETTDRKRILFAVSVVDALPSGLSSVYFFYDPEYAFLSPGVLSALIELRLLQMKPELFYYLGFYIHNCSKMRYKGQFAPSEILCPVTLLWTLLDDRLKELMDKQKYSKFALIDRPVVEKKKLYFGELKYLIHQRHLVMGSQLLSRFTIEKKYRETIQLFHDLSPNEIWKHIIIIVPDQCLLELK